MKKSMTMSMSLALGVALALGGTARAQRADAPPPDPDARAPDAPAEEEQEGALVPADPYAEAPTPAPASPVVEPAPLTQPEPEPPARPKPRRRLDFSQVFSAPTGYFLPAGVIVGSAGVDTGGGVTSDLGVGLGDVAEFGVSTGDFVRVVPCSGCDTENVDNYASAYFKMGLKENLLFKYQPAMALGFDKSFEKSHDNRDTRFAKLHFTLSKKLGKRFKAHSGVVFWDAVTADSSGEFLLNERGTRKQVRPFGGIEIEPLERSQLLLELDWVPEFRLGATAPEDSAQLRPMFSWGVRYQLTDWGVIESGVRIPDIGEVNLIDAQIFGQLRLYSWRFHDLLKRR